MPTVRCVRSVPVVRTARVAQLEGLFDLPPTADSRREWNVTLPLESRPWQIGLIVGPSGCGKTTLARELFPGQMVDGFDWPSDRSLVDAFPETMDITEITGILSAVGFSSPPAWLRPFGVLSNGEQFRATIARALAEQPDLAVLDEFTSVIDRTVARIGSAAVQKAVRRSGRKLVAVACHHDIIDWLNPDWIFEPDVNCFRWATHTEGDSAGSPGACFRRPEITLSISRVKGRQWWPRFRHHHYLATSLASSARCFLARLDGRPAAFTAAIATCNPSGASRTYWREHRSVCLPDFQGAGIGNALSEYVASLHRAAGLIYRSTTSSPAMINHRRRSPHWKQIRRPGYGASTRLTGEESNDIKHLRKGVARTRITASFEYLGPARPADAWRFGLIPQPPGTDPAAAHLPLLTT